VGAFEFYLRKTLKVLSENGQQIDLKPEQGAAIKSSVHGQDAFAILLTGFGKSAIYQILVQVKEKILKDCACVLVICPLQSLIEDQIKEAKSSRRQIIDIILSSASITSRPEHKFFETLHPSQFFE